ncbi:uncharacterized protein [Rutidosis leptorrhynchoides]|uniref:uncharacterized protein n=1 Tax=Rutidosis leptorrhynchoides TaxID=125765 RepID=UPI003A99FEA7
MVSQDGIEANIDKIRAIMDMAKPTDNKGVQRLTGQIAALGQFMSRSRDKCLPFFNALKRAFEWTLECREAFQELKRYLVSPPLLDKPTVGEPLFMYLTVSEVAVSVVLFKEEGGAGSLFTMPIEKTKADKYTQSDYPTQAIGLEKPKIEFWNMFFDGASKKSGNGAGIVLTSPDGFAIEYALALDFVSTNNEAEYEAMLAGLGLAQNLLVKNIRIHSDSQLVANQLIGDYEARSEMMGKYLKMVKALLGQFDHFEFIHVPRDQNQQADILSKLASGDLGGHRPTNIYRGVANTIDQHPLIAPIMCLPDWMTPIRSYILDGGLPDDSDEAQKFIRKSVKYTIIDGALYKSSTSGPFLRCLPRKMPTMLFVKHTKGYVDST